MPVETRLVGCFRQQVGPSVYYPIVRIHRVSSLAAIPEDVSYSPEVVHPPPHGLARPGQGDVAAGEAAAVEAAAAAALAVGAAGVRHSNYLKVLYT